MTVRIGDLALAAGAVTSAPLEQARAVQKANGSRLGAALVGLGFVTEEQVGLLGRKEKELQAVMDRFFATHPGGQPSFIARARQALATALALAWLEHHATNSEDEWRLLAQKAHEWLARLPEGAAFWLELAGEVVQP